MFNKISSYFPSNKVQWLGYIKTSLPVIFAAMILSFNSFIDNFMATSIQGGNQALSYANQWTQYDNGIISATTLVGTSIFGQYLGTGDKKKISEVIHVRLLIALIIAFVFLIPSLSASDFMVRLASGFDENLDREIINTAILYLRVITISWVLQAWFYTISMIIRESGHGSISLIASCLSLATNILLNSLFTFVFKMGIIGLAISTIISLILPIMLISIYIFIKDKRLIANPLKLFQISRLVWTQIGHRIPTFILATVSSICISTRFIFWNIGYETGSVGSNPLYCLSAANILGISGMFFNIFWTTFESINANVAIYVGRELGHNNFKQAKINAKQLQGFHLLVSIIIGVIFFSLSFAIEKMTFLTKGYTQQLESTLISKYGETEGMNLYNQIKQQAIFEYMENLKWTLWPLSLYMPMWIWYITKSRIISGGGRTNIVSLVDSVGGIIQIGFISLINFVIVPATSIAFPWAYTIFFISDAFKIPVFEILYYKVDWAKNITVEGLCVDDLIIENKK